MIQIEEPVHGAVLNHRLGQQTADGLAIEVRGRAPLLDRVTVNGVVATRHGERFSAHVILRHPQTDITARAEGPAGIAEHTVRVVWDRHSRPRYRFCIDDNSFFLRDIAEKRYNSLFDCFYLAMWRDLHREYGAKFQLNIYFTTGDDFALPQFPDTYKGEWADNADWLKLAFHAWANDPDRPYQYASPQQLAHDFDAVAEEILRFAGEATYSPPTILHWGMAQPESLSVLAERDVRVLSGYFRRSDWHWDVSYLLDDERCEYLSRHDALMDFDSGLLFSKVDIVCNTVSPDGVVAELQPLTESAATAEIMDLTTHEQYFWDFYVNYLPDHRARVDAALRWATEQGYEPVWFHEGFMGVEAP